MFSAQWVQGFLSSRFFSGVEVTAGCQEVSDAVDKMVAQPAYIVITT